MSSTIYLPALSLRLFCLILGLALAFVRTGESCEIDAHCHTQMTMFDPTYYNKDWICQRGACYKCGSAPEANSRCDAWIRRERDPDWKARITKSVLQYGSVKRHDPVDATPGEQSPQKAPEMLLPSSDHRVGQQVSREGAGDLYYSYEDHQWKDKDWTGR